MRNVTRIEMPISLQQNADKWKEKLLSELKNGDKKKIKTAKNKYRKKDVQKALKIMYNDQCCYCEARISEVTYPHIEHLKPKSQFPKETFDWDNLHLACQKCNVNKGKKYDLKIPVLDPCLDQDIMKEHLRYEFQLEGVYISPLTKRGKVTSEYVDLNRIDIVQGRHRVMTAALNLKQRLDQHEFTPKKELVLREVQNLILEKYGSVVKFVHNI